jgi:excisionase family DNA binding protein
MTTTTPTSSSPYLSVPEAADYLGVSVSFLKKAVAANRCPHRHLGRRVVLRKEQLDRWVDSRPGVSA